MRFRGDRPLGHDTRKSAAVQAISGVDRLDRITQRGGRLMGADQSARGRWTRRAGVLGVLAAALALPSGALAQPTDAQLLSVQVDGSSMSGVAMFAAVAVNEVIRYC